jgi:ATP-dependent exoDNAse (exonuclease V) alpha subunit
LFYNPVLLYGSVSGENVAIYHFQVRVVRRSKGQSAVAVAARRSGERLYDRLRGLHVRPDSGGSAPTFSAIMLPADAPAWMSSREELWNAAEASEKRVDAQLAREVEVALPLELGDEPAIALAREFVLQEFIQRGMIADLTIRLGGHNPYANAMLTMRSVTPAGFGRKVIAWNRRELLTQWRQQWADLANEYLGRAGYQVRIDHRRKRDQAGQEMAAAVHLGKAARAMQRRGLKHARLQRLEETRGGQPARDSE